MLRQAVSMESEKLPHNVVVTAEAALLEKKSSTDLREPIEKQIET